MVSLSYRSLVTFITENDLSGLQNFLENKRVIVDDRDENGATALHFASSKGKLNFVRELLHHGADVNAEDNDNWTPLLCAAKEGFTEICRELLDREAHIEHRDMGGWSALMWASYKGHSETVNMLLDAGSDVNAHGNFHISSLLWASGRGYTEIAKLLIQHGAKVNLADKYGTTALVWAARKGNAEIVDALLLANSNVDTAGMYSWTALLVATMGNHVDVVSLLLPCRPNVNAVDKDGCTALTIACKDGYTEIAAALLNSGAYINIQDRSGDTNLIHAVKGGHRSVVEALIKKYADIDIPGKERKTATYNAVEKGNIPILKLLLSANPDLEISTKDGDTPLLKAVRSRNTEAVQMLLERKARVNAADKWGDTALHIAMRARSKAIVEVLLRNPKNSQLLYRPNRAGETPYNIDMSHPKTILGQIFGSRRLNMNEDNESLLGYDLFSSALADILSEPSLSMPITVGLFAKWGSGKSFLLNKLREEMKNFARQWLEPGPSFSWVLLALVCHFAIITGLLTGILAFSWVAGLSVALSIIAIAYISLILLWWSSQRYSWNYLYNLNVSLTQRMSTIKIVLQVIFCHPPGMNGIDSLTAQPLRFYFTDQTRVSSTAAGENAVVQMIGSLYDSIEADFGSLSTRLYRAFRPKPAKLSSSWKFRRICCLPSIIVFEIIFISMLLIFGVLSVYLIELGKTENEVVMARMTGHILLGICGALVLITFIANSYSASRLISSLLFSQRTKLQRSIARIDTVKSEGFLQALRSEVTLMTQMVKCLDAFTQQQTRLVIVVDGLDSCEQDKVLFVLDAVHVLFSDASTPFIILLAIDPHIISKAVEVNSRRLISESNIGGHDYLRNMVHLPFYLQNSGLRKVRSAQKSANRKMQSAGSQQLYPFDEPQIPRSGSIRKLSVEAASAIPGDKLKMKSSGQRGSRKLKLSDSIASSLGSNLNRAGGPFDLSKMLLTDDYFSDVNPRSMRRLMNVVYVTGRLLKAFQIDFNWYHLASWINITEQWPYRTSWIILYHDSTEETIDDSISLKALYDKVCGFIPVSKDMDPLLELDRDEKKLDVFLTYHKSTLLIQDMRIFLPFTINLDPYIKKVIKEELQNAEETIGPTGWPTQFNTSGSDTWATPRKPNVNLRSRQKLGVVGRDGSLGGGTQPWAVPKYRTPQQQQYAMASQLQPYSTDSRDPLHTYGQMPPLPGEFADVRLESLDVSGVCNLLQRLPDLQPNQVSNYLQLIQANNINGRVLMYCNLEELKQVLRMSFGDWELFRMVVVGLRQLESFNPGWPPSGGLIQATDRAHLPSFRSAVRFHPPAQGGPRRDSKVNANREKTERQTSKQSAMEKQVTLEEQMICGALQTLNEEACEDVLEGQPTKRPTSESNNNNETDVRISQFRTRTSSQSSGHSVNSLNEETDMIILQNSPMQSHWTAVTYDSQSTGSSAGGGAADTPVLTRRRNDFSSQAMNEKKSVSRPRPSSTSLLLSYVGAGDGSPASISRSVQSASAPRSHSVDEHTQHNTGGLAVNVAAPVLRVTAPTVDQHSDDESTPLVSSLSSPESPEQNVESLPGGRDFTRPPSSLESLALDSAPHSNTSSPHHLKRQYSLSWDDPETSV